MASRYPGRKRSHVNYTQSNYDTALWLSQPGKDEQDAGSPELGAATKHHDFRPNSTQPSKQLMQLASQADNRGNSKSAHAAPQNAEQESPNTDLTLSKRLKNHKRSADDRVEVEKRPAKKRRARSSKSAAAPVGATAAAATDEPQADQVATKIKCGRLSRDTAAAREGAHEEQHSDPVGRQQPPKHANAALTSVQQGSKISRGATNSGSQSSQQPSKQEHCRQDDDDDLKTTFKQKQHSRSKSASESESDNKGRSKQGRKKQPVLKEAAAPGKQQPGSRKSLSTAADTAKSKADAQQKDAKKPLAAATSGGSGSKAAKGQGKSASEGAQAVASKQPGRATAATSAPAADVLADAGGAASQRSGGSMKAARGKAGGASAASPASAGDVADATVPAKPAAADSVDGKKLRSQKQQQPRSTSPAAATVAPVVDAAVVGSDKANALEFAKLQTEYRRLHAMYDELKAQKIQEMEGLVQEQDDYIVKMGEEARQLAEHWRKEAETQKKAAAAARASETQRLIKQLQDRDIAARATLLEKDTALAQLQAEIADLKQKLLEAGAKPDMVDASVQAVQTLQEVALDPLTAQTAYAAGAALTPAPPGRQFAACQFPTPPAAPEPSPGVGCQFPTPGTASYGHVAEVTAAAAADTTAVAAITTDNATSAEVGGEVQGPLAAAATAADPGGNLLMPAPYNTPGGINASMFPAGTDDLAAAVAATAGQPLPEAKTGAVAAMLDGAAGNGSESGTVRKQLQLSGSSGARGGGSSPVRGLVVRAGAAAPPAPSNALGGVMSGGLTGNSAAGGVACPQRGPGAGLYTTPGGINAFMFAAPSAAQLAANGGAHTAGSGGDFRFPASPGMTGQTGCLGYPMQQHVGFQPQALHGAPQMRVAAGSGGQNSDNGSYVFGGARNQAGGSNHNVGFPQQQLEQQLAAALVPAGGMFGPRGSRDAAGGLMSPPPAPHSTPIAYGDAGTTGTASRPAALRQWQQHQPSPASSAGSLARIQARAQQLDNLKLALKQGLEPMLARAATEGGAIASGGGEGPTAASPGVALQSRVLQGHLRQQTPQQGYRTPHTTPLSTPEVRAAAAACLPADQVAAALAGLAAVAGTAQDQPATAAAAAAADPEAGFAGFFSPAAAAGGMEEGAKSLTTPDGAAATAAGDKRDLAGDAAAVHHAGNQGGHAPGSPLTGAVGLPGSAAAATRRRSDRFAKPTPPGGRSSVSRGPPSATRHLLPLMYLCDFDPQLLSGGNIQYRHSATGFTFQLGPAVSSMTAPTPGCGSYRSVDGSDDEGMESSDEGAEEEVVFVPLQMGSAETCLPGFLKEAITFSPSQKPQFMKLLFQALAEATKAKAAAAAAAAATQRGAKGTRHRRSSRHQQPQQGERDDGAAAATTEQAPGATFAVPGNGTAEDESHANKENAAAPRGHVTAVGKGAAAGTLAAAAFDNAH